MGSGPAGDVLIAAPVCRESTTEDSLTHIVEDRQKVRRAMLERTPVQALCGRVWVPTRWKPKDAMRCRVCDELARARYPVGP